MAGVGLAFEAQLIVATNAVVDRIGFAGLCAIMLVNDMLVTPLPGDLLLVVIAKSDLSQDWPRYVLVLGLMSVLAGTLGLLVTRRLSCTYCWVSAKGGTPWY